jgi:hypothetical protein
MGREISSFFMSKITKKKFDDYGNDFRAGRKNIDDLYKQFISDITSSSREESKFQYVMKDVFEVMRSLGWTGEDTFEVNVGGCAATGTATHPDANPKWAKPFGTITYQKDAFIVIKNANKNPVVSSQALQLPEGQGKPVVVD